jgi:hypothetical protein
MRCLVEGAPILRPSDDEDDGVDEEEEDVEEEDAGRIRAVYKVGPKGNVKLLPGGVDEVSSHLTFPKAYTDCRWLNNIST